MSFLALAWFLFPLWAGSAPDSWAAFRPRLAVDPSGRYGVEIRLSEPPKEGEEQPSGPRLDLDYRWFRLPPSAPDLEPIEDLDAEGASLPSEVIELGAGRLKVDPLTLLVSSSGAGFYALHCYGGIGRGTCIWIVGSDGRPTHSVEFSELFDRESRRPLDSSVGSTWWLRSAWIDEEAGELLVAAKTGDLRAIDGETGAVRVAGEAELRSGLRQDASRALCLPHALEWKLEGLHDELDRWLEDSTLPVRDRLHAGLVLARRIDPRASRLFRAVESGVQPEMKPADRRFATLHYFDVLGPAALPRLTAILCDPAHIAWDEAEEALGSAGEQAVAPLIAVLENRELAEQTRAGAAYALGRIRSYTALPCVLEAIRDPSKQVSQRAFNAALSIGDYRLARDFAAILEDGSLHDDRLVSFLRSWMHPDAIPALKLARERTAPGSPERAKIDEALAKQRADFRRTGGAASQPTR